LRASASILALISAALFAWVLGSEANEITLSDLSVFAVALAVILTIQLFLLFCLDKLVEVIAPGKKEWILLVAATVLLASNAYFLAFYTLDRPMGFRIGCSVVVGVTFLILMSVPRIRPALALFAGVMLTMSLIQYGYTRVIFRAGSDVTADIASLPVNSKRNVYIIGMESLHSPKAYRENYDIHDALHEKLLRDAGFRVLDYAYSGGRSTIMSYAHLFEFKRPFLRQSLQARGVLINDNSTFRSFRDANYRIQFLYKNNYLPVNSKNVDFMFTPPAFDACDELGAKYFYGLCSSNVVNVINNYIFGFRKLRWKTQITLLQKRTDYVIESPHPWLTWTHISYPFHTTISMRHPDPEYAAEFKQRVREAMPEIAQVVKNGPLYIAAKDPDAVVIVLGDHGTNLFRLKRSNERKVREQVFSNVPLWPLKTVLEDQHGVMLAVYPASFCENRISEPFSTKGLIENLIACLNGDDSPTDEERSRARRIRFLGDLWDVGEVHGPNAEKQHLNRLN
jgi:hypothetical protein